ncbi:MAG: hypothetical protein Ct9H300mP1_00430 [Planctomycetaceae bacterium]|nr:MAG: hypothetical protein Ct9H300mP1_00430 [Planctomycetaceae bacterium]
MIDGVAPDKTQALLGPRNRRSFSRPGRHLDTVRRRPPRHLATRPGPPSDRSRSNGRQHRSASGGNVIRARRALYDAREHRGPMLDADLLAKLPGGRVPLRIRAERSARRGNTASTPTTPGPPPAPSASPATGSKPVTSSSIVGACPLARHTHRWPQRRPGGLDPFTEQPGCCSAKRLSSSSPTWQAPRSGSQFSTATGKVPAGQRVRVPDQDDLEPVLPAFDRANRRSRLVLHADYFTDAARSSVADSPTNSRDCWECPATWRDGATGLPLRPRCRQPRSRPTKSWPRLDPSWRGPGLIHRHEVPGGFTIRGEVGYLSDRNLLEQYYEEEFDEQKDQDTMLRLEKFGARTPPGPCWPNAAQRLRAHHRVAAGGDITSSPAVDGQPPRGGRHSAGPHTLRPATPGSAGRRPLDPTDSSHHSPTRPRRRCRADVSPRTVLP